MYGMTRDALALVRECPWHSVRLLPSREIAPLRSHKDRWTARGYAQTWALNNPGFRVGVWNRRSETGMSMETVEWLT